MNAMSILGGLFALLAGIVGGDPAGCLVYLHQNKAGGTTMKAVLREKLRPPVAGARRGRFGQCAYGEYRTNGCWPPKYWSGAGGVERWLFYGDAVMGMLGAGWLGSVRGGSRCRAFTLFREPTARLVSAWGFCKRARSDELCGTKALDARNATLRQWARHWRHFATTQLDLAPGRRPDRRRLEAAYDDDDEGAAFHTDAVWVARRDARGDAANDAAAARLAARVAAGSLFAFVGVLERAEDTARSWDVLLPLRDGSSWRDAFAGKRHNADPGARAAPEPDARRDAEVQRYLAADYALYRAANAALDRQLPR